MPNQTNILWITVTKCPGQAGVKFAESYRIECYYFRAPQNCNLISLLDDIPKNQMSSMNQSEMLRKTKIKNAF